MDRLFYCFFLVPFYLCALLDVPYSTYNAKSVGNNLNALIEAGTINAGLTAVVDSIMALDSAEANEALTQLQGSQYSAVTEMQADINGQIISIFHRKPYLACCCRGRGRLWVEPFGNWLKEKSFGEEVGFHSDTGGVAVGLDGEVMPGWVIGAGFAWDKVNLKWEEYRGHGSYQGYYGSLYTDYQSDQFYLGLACLAGEDLYDTSRKIVFTTYDETAHAHFNALDISAQLSMAYLFGTSSAYAYPYANVDYLYLRSRAISETQAGSLNLEISPNTSQTLRTEVGVGVQVQDTNRQNTICVSPMIALGWVMECPIGRQQYTSLFEGEDISYQVKGWNHAWQIFSIDFGLSLAYQGFLASVRYNAETSAQRHNRFFGQRCNVHLEWRW